MTTPAAAPPAPAPSAARNYLNAAWGVRTWLLSTDHKRIALLYLASVTAMFALGGAFAVGIRLELVTPHGDLMQAETYNKFFTQHGVFMVFFFLIPAIPAVLGNFLIPIMVGAKDLAFPKLNLLSWYLYLIGALFTLWALVNGGIDTGWTFYPPYSTAYSNTNVIATGLGVFVAGFSSILTGLNFIVTIHKMRAPGLTWFRLPLFVWAHYATSVIQVLGTPVVAVTVLMLAVERVLHLGFFDPALGGDPILFQHLFWFYSHPAVYIMILPAMGVMSELVTCFSRKRVFGYEFIAVSSLMIAVVGFLVWGHHMFVSGQSTYAGLVFSALSFLVAIPSAVKVFNWTATLYKGSISYDAPMLYAFGFIGLFTIGGLTGLFLAAMGLDVHVHDTYFVVAHFHYIMVGGTIMGYLGGLHFWWPKITGRLYPELWARVAAAVVFVGFNLTFFPQFVLGYLGMPRRYHAYPDEFQVLNVMSSAGASILGLGYLIPMVYLIWSMRYGRPAAANPWKARGLEWQIASPPITQNFEHQPVVTREAYDYDQAWYATPEVNSGVAPERGAPAPRAPGPDANNPTPGPDLRDR
jgi:cytochrome c oxidase subunit 1